MKENASKRVKRMMEDIQKTVTSLNETIESDFDLFA